MRPEPDEGLVVGRLVGPFGIRGELKLLPLTDFPERLQQRRTLRLRRPEGDVEERRVVSMRPHQAVLVVRLEECDSREAAEDLRGAEVWIPEEEAAPLPEGHFYVHQIVGLRVVTEDDEELGQVDEVLQMGANDIYRVGKLLIPGTRDAVLKLDPAEGVMVTRSRAYLEGE